MPLLPAWVDAQATADLRSVAKCQHGTQATPAYFRDCCRSVVVGHFYDPAQSRLSIWAKGQENHGSQICGSAGPPRRPSTRPTFQLGEGSSEPLIADPRQSGACCAAARARVTFSNVCFAWAAWRFTVSTKLGIRSYSLFKCTSIPPHASATRFFNFTDRL